MFVVGLITLEINALQLLPVCLGEWEMYWEIIYGAFVIFFFFLGGGNLLSHQQNFT